jgi:hypothetical protein
MPWNADQESLQFLAGAGQPPDIASIMGDPMWAQTFYRWADDHSLQVQDIDLQSYAEFVAFSHQGWTITQLYERFGARDGFSRIDRWGAELLSDFGFAAHDGQDTVNAMPRLWENATEYLAQYRDAFAADVDANVGVSDPTMADHIDPNDFDQSVIDGVNEYNLKNLDEGGVISFFQARDLVLIGDGFPMEYVRYAANAGTGGTITMESRGSFGSTGEILVEGSSDPDSFKAAVRRFSKKKITFG